jgi:SAM-dependent methyltransferase
MTEANPAPLVRASWFHRGLHLREDQLEPAEAACPLCLSGEPRPPIFRLQAAPDVDLLSCRSCGAYSASRMPTPEALRSYYRDYYKEADERVTFDLPQRLARHIFRGAFTTVARRTIDVLDFGGGDAEVARRIAKLLLDAGASGVRILLVDFNAEVPVLDSPLIRLERADTLEGIEAESFDLVIASAILEHIPHPRRDLTSLLKALRAGGVFYARTPSVVPLLRLFQIFGVRSDFTFPGHVHDLGEKFWGTILGRLPLGDAVEILDSRPALVETTLGIHPLRTVAAHMLKAPWRVLGSSYGLIGGWEVFFRRRGSA